MGTIMLSGTYTGRARSTLILQRRLTKIVRIKLIFIVIRLTKYDAELDLEYRFWSFMEVYPAHCSLPINSNKEAMDVLTWAWTGTQIEEYTIPVLKFVLLDRLLPSAARAIPSPFKQEECQELMNLLKSFGHGTTSSNQDVQPFLTSIFL